ncbi:1809_t:CDS:1 [Ambispora gerdemannii]|uniref:1809_t:CDS:1 n=1 Tax=Ambispora gerdemannii TaxID=144530 RepID=A0A9N9BSY2_9GLOM|nr:1809_t:CDS:1 [Ambispora gerdemannii]
MFTSSPTTIISRTTQKQFYKTTFKSWLTSSPCLLLDFRPWSMHLRRHIIPSTCIPYTELEQHWYELPPKQIPFAVLEPTDAQGVTKKMLIDNGWSVPWIFVIQEEKDFINGNGGGDEKKRDKGEEEILWSVACEFDVLEEIDTETISNLESFSSPFIKRWTLFQPNPFLKENIKTIEQTLLSDFPPSFAAPPFDSSCSLSNPVSLRTLHCLDIGCGSGRDTVWLCSSRKTSAHHWHVTALDNWPSALARTKKLATGLGVIQNIDIVCAKVMPDGTIKKIRNSGSSHKISDHKNNHDGNKENNYQKSYDLLLTLRFLSREFFPTIPSHIKPGGFLMISTFVNDGTHEFSQPKSPAHRLEPGELATVFSKDFEILVDRIEVISDGRPVNSFLARRKKS